MALLKADHLSKEFAVEGGLLRRRLGAVRALDDVSFALEEGESLGLVGESGSGKTTLGKIVAGFLAPDGGRLSWEGRPLESLSPAERAARVQMIFQDPAASLNPKLSLLTILHEAVCAGARLAGTRALSRAEADGRVQDLLAAVGLPTDALLYYPHQFSGGQKQ